MISVVQRDALFMELQRDDLLRHNAGFLIAIWPQLVSLGTPSAVRLAAAIMNGPFCRHLELLAQPPVVPLPPGPRFRVGMGASVSVAHVLSIAPPEHRRRVEEALNNAADAAAASAGASRVLQQQLLARVGPNVGHILLRDAAAVAADVVIPPVLRRERPAATPSPSGSPPLLQPRSRRRIESALAPRDAPAPRVLFDEPLSAAPAVLSFAPAAAAAPLPAMQQPPPRPVVRMFGMVVPMTDASYARHLANMAALASAAEAVLPAALAVVPRADAASAFVPRVAAVPAVVARAAVLPAAVQRDAASAPPAAHFAPAALAVLPAPRAVPRAPSPIVARALAWARSTIFELQDVPTREWGGALIDVLIFLLQHGGAARLVSSSGGFYSLVLFIKHTLRGHFIGVAKTSLSRVLAAVPDNVRHIAHPANALKNGTWMTPDEWAAFILKGTSLNNRPLAFFSSIFGDAAREVARRNNYDEMSRAALVYAVTIGSRVSGLFPPAYKP